MIDVAIHNETDVNPPTDRLQTVVRTILADHGFRTAEVSLAIVDDETIHRLNREYLQHDYPTDVLSFVLDAQDEFLCGEVIVSADTASLVANDYALETVDEMLLYFVHGTLHLVGYDDHAPQDRRKMREQERFYLEGIGIKLPDSHSEDPEAVP